MLHTSPENAPALRAQGGRRRTPSHLPRTESAMNQRRAAKAVDRNEGVPLAPDLTRGDRGPDSFSIGDLAREFGVTLRALRFYEDKGLLTPRRIGQTRLYSRRDRARLKLVLMGKKVGFSLLEI